MLMERFEHCANSLRARIQAKWLMHFSVAWTVGRPDWVLDYATFGTSMG